MSIIKLLSSAGQCIADYYNDSTYDVFSVVKAIVKQYIVIIW